MQMNKELSSEMTATIAHNIEIIDEIRRQVPGAPREVARFGRYVMEGMFTNVPSDAMVELGWSLGFIEGVATALAIDVDDLIDMVCARSRV